MINRTVDFIETNWIVLTTLVLAAITVLSLVPLDELPEVPGTDKTHHVIAYAVLMFSVALKKPKYWILIGVFFVAYSGGIELIQPYVNRYGEWVDLLANTLGLILGTIAGFFVNYYTKKRLN